MPAGQRCPPHLSLQSPCRQLLEVDGRGGEQGLDLNLRAPTERRPGEPRLLLGVGEVGLCQVGTGACWPPLNGSSVPTPGDDLIASARRAR